MGNNAYRIVLIAILIIALFLRFYKLGEVPYGFYQDESAIGYNAFSIIKTGQDEHALPFPLYFKSFGDYKLPVYIYLTAFSIKLFGLTEFAVRFPSALFSFLTIPAFYLFILALTKKQNLATFATALLAINPWHLHYGRATFEVSICLFFFVLGGLLLHKAFTRQKIGTFFFGTLCFVISLYSYNITRLLAPALFILFLIFYREQIKTVQKREIFVTMAVSFGLLVPFLVTLLQSGGTQSALGTFLFSSAAVKAPLLEFRSYLIDMPTIFTKTFFNMFTMTVWQYIQHVVSYLSVPFFFISGSNHGNHGIGNVGQFYLFELPLIMLGLYKIILGKISWGYFLLLWAALTIIVASLTREAPHATRSFFLIAPFIAFCALGALTLWSWIQTLKNATFRLGVIILAVVFVGYNLLYYFTSYYVRFPAAYAKAWRSEDKALSLYLAEVEQNYEKIVVDKKAGFIYTSLLFYRQFPPSEFHKTAVYEPEDSEGMSHVARFGKYEFKEIDWTNDLRQPKSLIITSVERKPNEVNPLRIFSYPARPVVIATKQEILQYPVEEIAYVVFETQ